MAPRSMSNQTIQQAKDAPPRAAVTAFVCINAARAGQAPAAAGRCRPTLPEFDWPFAVEEMTVACTGRLQPEHVLKAFESGSDLVCLVACEEDNCHYLEGSKRCARRVDYLRSVLDEIGLGGNRLMLFHLPGSAAEDTMLHSEPATSVSDINNRVAAIRDAVTQALSELSPNALFTGTHAHVADELYQEVDTSDDDNEE